MTRSYDLDCAETYEGLNYFKKGATKYRGNSEPYVYVDHCATILGTVNKGMSNEYTLSEGDLIEYSCHDELGNEACSQFSCSFIKYSCPNGCEHGACIE